MLEELVACLINLWRIGIAFEIARVEDLAWEVVASIEKLEEAAYGIQIFVDEVDAALLRRKLLLI